MSSVQLVLLIIQAILFIAPAFATEVATKAHASQAVKSTVNVVFAAGAAALIQFTIEPTWNWRQVLIHFGIAWLASVVAHSTGMTRKVQNATASVGIGPKDTGEIEQAVKAEHADEDEGADTDPPEDPTNADNDVSV